MGYHVEGKEYNVVSEPSCYEQNWLGLLSDESVIEYGGVPVLEGRNMLPEKGETPVEGEEVVTSIYAAGICCPSEVPIINKVLGQINGKNT